MRGEISGA